MAQGLALHQSLTGTSLFLIWSLGVVENMAQHGQRVRFLVGDGGYRVNPPTYTSPMGLVTSHDEATVPLPRRARTSKPVRWPVGRMNLTTHSFSVAKPSGKGVVVGRPVKRNLSSGLGPGQGAEFATVTKRSGSLASLSPATSGSGSVSENSLGLKLAKEGTLRRHASQGTIHLSPVRKASARGTDLRLPSSGRVSMMSACKLQVLGSGRSGGGMWQTKDQPSARYVELAGAFQQSEQRENKSRKLLGNSKVIEDSLQIKAIQPLNTPHWVPRKAGGASSTTLARVSGPGTHTHSARSERLHTAVRLELEAARLAEQPILPSIGCTNQRAAVPSAQWSRTAQANTPNAIADRPPASADDIPPEDLPAEELQNFRSWCSSLAETASSDWKCTRWLAQTISPSSLLNLDEAGDSHSLSVKLSAT